MPPFEPHAFTLRNHTGTRLHHHSPQVVKNTIMKTFFDGPYLENYMNTKMKSLAGEIDVAEKLKQVSPLQYAPELPTLAAPPHLPAHARHATATISPWDGV